MGRISVQSRLWNSATIRRTWSSKAYLAEENRRNRSCYHYYTVLFAFHCYNLLLYSKLSLKVKGNSLKFSTELLQCKKHDPPMSYTRAVAQIGRSTPPPTLRYKPTTGKSNSSSAATPVVSEPRVVTTRSTAPQKKKTGKFQAVKSSEDTPNYQISRSEPHPLPYTVERTPAPPPLTTPKV